MFSERISKSSVRTLLNRKSLPQKIFLHVTCDKLHDLLKWNGMEKKYYIYELVYTIWFTSTGRKVGKLTGNFTLRRR